MIILPEVSLYSDLSSYVRVSSCRGALHSIISPPSVLQLHLPNIFIIQRGSEEEVDSMLNSCLNYIKIALHNFVDNLMNAVPT